MTIEQKALHDGCPGCGSVRPALVWAIGPGTTRTYRCVDCRKRWTVDGRQQALDLGPVEVAPLALQLLEVRS